MELKEALEIVLELAEQNALAEIDCVGDEDLLNEAKRQNEALEAVRIYFEAHAPWKGLAEEK